MALLMATVPVLADTADRMIQASFRNIKIVVDGNIITPKDGTGKDVEPFIVNGTTYLPVRAVANAVGKEVYWDGPNWTVYLGKVPNGIIAVPP